MMIPKEDVEIKIALLQEVRSMIKEEMVSVESRNVLCEVYRIVLDSIVNDLDILSEKRGWKQ